MSEPTPGTHNVGASTRYQFGTFELDGLTGELRRNGVKLRLQEQPFLVLRKLLEGSGTLVSREDLHAALWPADTFVDFDTSLNTAIKRLREVLGDSADVPVFIETVPRRGYRFLAPVRALRNGANAALVPEPSLPTAAVPVPVGSAKRYLFIAGALLAVAAAVALFVWRSPAPLPRVTDSTQLTFDGLGKGDVRVAGNFVFFNELVPNGVALVKVPTAGGAPTILDSSRPGLYLGDVSPDGAKLLLGAPVNPKGSTFRLKLMLMDTTSSSLRDIETEGEGGNDVAWAPGGKIVFSRGPEIFVADVDLSHQHRLLVAPGSAFYLRFSPDGQTLRFTVANILEPARAIWEARADGSGLHQLQPEGLDTENVCCGEWTPDGRYFLFQTRRNGETRIWAMTEKPAFWRRNSRAAVQLATGPPNFYMGAPSPDGKKLYVTAAQPRAELVRYDSRVNQFVPYLSGISAGDLEGSPDGRSLVYVKYPELTLWRAKVDGTEATQITGPSLRVALPHWSPDGKTIAFSGSRPNGPWNIFLIPSTGGPAEQITNGAIADLDATWSPEGKKIAFGERRSEGKKVVYSVKILDLATRQMSSLADSEGICCPRWSPDGRYLLTSHEAYDDLLLFEFATQKWSLLVKDLGPIGYMEWSGDSKSIIFDTFEAKNSAIYRLRLADSHLDTITSTDEVRRFYGEFGPWAGLAPDGSPILVRDISNEEVYALDLQLP
jgi:Tol biopolymer transport system component/DNA-binding winged helix-turn-helix (wHTH) protein